jgi:hypothetical protein
MSEILSTFVMQENIIAMAYADYLAEKLKKVNANDDGLHNDLTVKHLLWMCEKIKVGDMSITKSNRWIGYIQGVMITRGFSTVLEERTDYVSVKEQVMEKYYESSKNSPMHGTT